MLAAEISGVNGLDVTSDNTLKKKINFLRAQI